jgi:creatinine amidohydrolase
MEYGSLRWVDIDSLDKSNKVVVCPIASLEQHGHHLPLLTDTFLVTEVARRAHAVVGDQMLLTPTLWVGASDHHLDYPGTVSVPYRLYIDLIKAMLRCFLQAGFQKILFLNGHGGNVAPGETAIYELATEREDCDGAYVVLGSYWTIAAEAMAAERHGMGTPNLTHACEYETSMMLAIDERLVTLGAAKGHATNLLGLPKGVASAGRFRRMTATGAMGQPELATAAKGESLLAAIEGEVVSLIRRMASWPPRPLLGPVRPEA